MRCDRRRRRRPAGPAASPLPQTRRASPRQSPRAALWIGGIAARARWVSAIRPSSSASVVRSMRPASSAQFRSTPANAGQTPVDVVVGAEDGRDLGKHRRLVTLQPARLCGKELLVHAVPGFREERCARRPRQQARRPRRRCGRRFAGCSAGAAFRPRREARSPGPCR